jgi:hypothetical protein
MQGCDLPHVVSLALSADPLRGLTPPAHTAGTDQDWPVCPWTLHTPPLRYEVASLEHWLDLNA